MSVLTLCWTHQHYTWCQTQLQTQNQSEFILELVFPAETSFFWEIWKSKNISFFLQSYRLYNYVKFIFISCLQLLQKVECGKKRPIWGYVRTRFFWSKFGKVRQSVFLQLFRLYNYVKFVFISCLQLLQKSKSKWVVNVVKKGPFEGCLLYTSPSPRD